MLSLLGNRIREGLQAARIASVNQLALDCGIDQSLLNKIVNGVKKPSEGILKTLSGRLRIPVEELKALADADELGPQRVTRAWWAVQEPGTSRGTPEDPLILGVTDENVNLLVQEFGPQFTDDYLKIVEERLSEGSSREDAEAMAMVTISFRTAQIIANALAQNLGQVLRASSLRFQGDRHDP